MPIFGAAARFSAAETSRGAQAFGTSQGMHGGYGGPPPPAPAPAPAPASVPAPAPGVPALPGTPPIGMPRKRGKHPVPPPPVPDVAGSLAAFVREELTRLLQNEGQDVWLRAGLLTALSERIRIQQTTWEQNNESKEARTALGALSTELATPTADPSEVDRRWQKVITTLQSLTANPPSRSRRPFWKR
jgi:hypothetical protein